MTTLDPLQAWVTRIDRRWYMILVGTAIGILGGATGLLIAITDPILATGFVIGILAGLYILTNVQAALYGVVAIVALLPFATFPFRIGFTPTLLDGALGAFVVVYLFQWMTGRRLTLHITPVHAPLLLYIGWLILSFILGLRYAPPTATIARQFAETIISISMVIIIVDLVRDRLVLRRVVSVVIVLIAAQALAALVLWLMPDANAERTLIRLARLGYPNGGVIRYIEDNPALPERAIGTWVDPNALGGLLACGSALLAPQLFARKRLFRQRWLTLLLLGLCVAALGLTFSRASMLAFAGTVALVGLFKGYRRFWGLILLGGVLVLLLPQTQGYVERFIDAFTNQDLATQMRVGEYTDSLTLIGRYPLTGVGFTGVPDIDLYTSAASTYLIMANHIGVTGVAIFALTMISTFVYGARQWRLVRADDDLRSIFLGVYGALLALLINGVADHYFFRLEFHASITLFWLMVGLALCTATIARYKSTVANERSLL